MNTPIPLFAPQVRPKSWFQRHAVLAILLALLLFGTGSVCLVFFGVEYSFKSSDVYAEALNRAQHSAKVIQATGSPITPGRLVWGSIYIHNNTGDADIWIPIAGPKGKASVHAVAKKSNGAWHGDTLEAELHHGQEHVDLLKSADVLGHP